MYLENEREIDIFFPPVRLDRNQSSCLEMKFASFAHFEVKLAYAADDAYKQRLLFRSVESLGKEFRLWKATITPDMTEGEAFVVILHSRRSSLGTMAVIKSIQLLMEACSTTGERVVVVVVVVTRCEPKGGLHQPHLDRHLANGHFFI